MRLGPASGTFARRGVPAGAALPACRGIVPAVALLVLGGCAAFGPLPARLRPEVARPQPGVVIFLCDGFSPDVLERGCREGWLPNIRRRFVVGGTRVEDAFTVVPSITYAAITSLLTGTTPAAHGIPGNRWFDPDRRLFRNYATIAHYRDVNADFSLPTLYERIAPLRSASIQAAHMRGVTDNIANWAQSGILWFFGNYADVDKLTLCTVNLEARRSNRRGWWPAVLTCYCPGLDSIGHAHGPSSSAYRRAAENIDYHLGRVCDWLEREGLLENTYLILCADHGMVDVDRRLDLMYVVRDGWGRRATDRMLQDGPLAERSAYFDRFDTVVAYQDGRKASLYFRGPSGWDASPPPEAVADILTAPPEQQRLWNLPGVELVAYLAGPRTAVIRAPGGTARIEERTARGAAEYRYVPVPGDPLGYLDDPELAAFVAAGFHDSRAWLHATAGQRLPEVVPHLVPLLRGRRFGQVLVFAAPGTSFVREAGGHGGLDRREMRIPLLFAGPGVEAGGTLEYARSVDLVPTIMTFLGVALPQDGTLAGVPLFEREAVARGPERPR